MGKYRNKSKSQGGGKPWLNRQSSNANSQMKKRGSKSKSYKSSAQSNLIKNGLRKPDFKIKSSKHSHPFMARAHANRNSNKTRDAFASNWNGCSNTSFDKLTRTLKSDSVHHKEILAVLAAITEVIKSQNGTGSSSEYYAALMTTLESTEVEESVAAILSLIVLVIEQVSRSVLCAQSSSAIEVFLNLLDKYNQSDNNVIFRSLITCIAVLLKSEELDAWNNTVTVKALNAILAFTVHLKPKIRKAAQHSIINILKESHFMLKTDEDGPLYHPGAALAADYCIELIEKDRDSVGTQTTVLHILTFLKEIIHTFPEKQIETICDEILKAKKLNNALINSCSMQVYNALFSAQRVTVSATVNERIITSLYDFELTSTDAQLIVTWIAVMRNAHVHLADADISICIKRLPQIMHKFTKLWLSDNKDIVTSITKSMEAFVQDCIGPACDGPEATEQHAENLKKCFEELNQCFGCEFYPMCKQVLHITNSLFKVAGTNCTDMLLDTLQVLSEFLNSDKLSCKKEVGFCIGSAIRYMGPNVLLNIVSFTKKDEDVNIDINWLVKLLRENVQNNSLEYFKENIVPLISKCKKRSEDLKKQNNLNHSHKLQLFCTQLWALLPSFCNSTSNITSCFKSKVERKMSFAQMLTAVIQNDKEYRLPVMNALRKVICRSMENDQKDDINALATHAKMFLPVLFNFYNTPPKGSDEDGQRLVALETIKIYLIITPDNEREELFDDVLLKISENNSETYFDLIRLLCIYQRSKKLDKLYEQCVRKLTGNKSHHQLQKKAYRVIEDICASDKSECEKFVVEKREELQKILLKTLNKTAPSSKGVRIRCFNLLIKSQTDIESENPFLRGALTEAVASIRDINERCRTAAQALLITVGNSLLKMNQMNNYIALIMSGLIGTTDMKSNTILALISVLFHFKDVLNAQHLKLILEEVCKIITCDIKEIVEPCIDFMKVYQTVVSSTVGMASLPIVVESLSKIKKSCKVHFQSKIKKLLKRFVRKYDYDTVCGYVPKSDTIIHKHLGNLKKIIANKKGQENEKMQDHKNDEKDFQIKAKPIRTVEEILASSDSEIEDEKMESDKSSKLNKDDTNLVNSSTVKKVKESEIQNKGARKRKRNITESSNQEVALSKTGSSADIRKHQNSDCESFQVKDDVKKPEKTDQSVRIPSQDNLLHKRKKMKQTEQRRNIVQGARKGSVKDRKA